VQFTPRWGTRTPAATGGAEVVVRGDAVSGPPRTGGGTPIPRDGYVLSGSGDAASFLRRATGPLEVTTELRDPAPLLLADLAGVVSGGPRLVKNGRISVATRAEGFDRPGLYGRFVAARNPRTLAGVKADGTLLLVTVDGRHPGRSGMSLPEAARLMQSLGALDALNLDGGGSTAMVVRGRVVNRPSDRVGERAVGDGVFVEP
jgi:exopolysaccharide biosynthesis protein